MNDTLTKIFTIPANLDQFDIQKALEAEPQKYFPDSCEKLYFDFKVLEKSENTQQIEVYASTVKCSNCKELLKKDTQKWGFIYLGAIFLAALFICTLWFFNIDAIAALQGTINAN